MPEDRQLHVAVLTDVGKVREQNEDSYAIREAVGRTLVAVCDGMGGHQAGEVASRIAADTLLDVFDAAQGSQPAEVLRDALMTANAAILAAARETSRKGMGTTAIVAWIEGHTAWFGQVGDSRLYVIREGCVFARTRDHTRVEAMVQRGEISEEESRNHAQTGILTRALGHRKMADGEPFAPEISLGGFELCEGDALVLCSDGLHDLVYDAEIAEVVAGSTPEAAAHKLVQMALDRGGHDNVTVIVLTVGEQATPAAPSEVPSAPVSRTEASSRRNVLAILSFGLFSLLCAAVLWGTALWWWLQHA